MDKQKQIKSDKKSSIALLHCMESIFYVLITLSCSFPQKEKNVGSFPGENPKYNDSQNSPVVTYKPGSLWSPISSWNSLYSNTPNYSVGDLISVKSSDYLKNKILSLVEETKNNVKSNQKASQEKTVKEKVGTSAQTVAEASNQQKTYNPPETIKATITEALPKETYSIVGTEFIQDQDFSSMLVVEGKIKKKDLASDDSISADSIHGLKLSIKKNEVGNKL